VEVTARNISAASGAAGGGATLRVGRHRERHSEGDTERGTVREPQREAQ
jgi:hypothetical protein